MKKARGMFKGTLVFAGIALLFQGCAGTSTSYEAGKDGEYIKSSARAYAVGSKSDVQVKRMKASVSGASIEAAQSKSESKGR